jgi:putative inorganic carbon (hco3(-)) transporter
MLTRIARGLDKFIFCGLLAVIVLAVVPYGTVDTWWEALFECLVFALTALWLIEAFVSGRYEIRRIAILLPLLLITVYAFAQTINWPVGWLSANSLQHSITIDRYQTFITARKSLALLLLMALLLVHISRPSRLRWLVRLVLVVGVASAIFGILRQLVQSPDSTTGFGLPLLFYGMGYGEFLSPNAFAYLMEMTYGVLIGVALGGGVRRNVFALYLAAAIVVSAALVLSNSRGGIVSFICQTILVLFIGFSWYSRPTETVRSDRLSLFESLRASRLVRVVVFLILVGTVIIGVTWMGGQQLATKLERSSIAQSGLDGSSRKEIWYATWQLIKHHPLTGVGFGNYFLAIPQYQLGSGGTRLEQSHNEYLDLAANGGLIAVVLGAWFVGLVIRRSIFSLRSPDKYRRAVALGSGAAVLGIAIHSLVDFGLQLTGVAVVFAGLLLLLVADNRVESMTRRIR